MTLTSSIVFGFFLLFLATPVAARLRAASTDTAGLGIGGTPIGQNEYRRHQDAARRYVDRSTTSEHVHKMAALGLLKHVQVYLDRDASHHLVHARDQDGWTLLHEAVTNNHIDIVEYLLDERYPEQVNDLLNAETFQGQTALDLALRSNGGDPDAPIVRLLVSKGALLDTGDDQAKEAIAFLRKGTKTEMLDRHQS